MPRFNITVLMGMLGAEWGVYSLENCRPSDLGYWATSRTRRYDIIYLKQALRPVGDPVEMYQRLTAVLSQKCVPFNAAFFDGKEDLHREMLQTASQGSDVRSKMAAAVDMTAEDVMRQHLTDWTSLLNSWEVENLQQYLKLFPERECFGLGQSATQRPTTATTRGQWPCFRKGGTAKLWCEARRRWISAHEKAGMMGWPVTEDCSACESI